MEQNTTRAELELLGYIIADPSLWTDAFREDDFQYGATRDLFVILSRLRRSGKQITRSAVEAQGGKETTECVKAAVKLGAIPTLSAYTNAANTVREAGTRRRVYEKTVELLGALESGSPISEVQGLITAAGNAAAQADSGEMLSLLEGYASFTEHMTEPIEYIQTDWPTLDAELLISPGDFLIIGGRPSNGKTAYSLQMAAQLAKKHKVLYFSYETSNEKLIERMVASLAKVNFAKVKRHKLEEWERNEVMSTDVLRIDLTFVRAAGQSVEWIAQRALQSKAEIIFIDYIGLIRTQGASRYEIVTNASMELHTLAQKYGITVVALSQLRRGESTKRPGMEDLRESGQIEQDADAILLMQKGDEHPKPGGGHSGVYDHTVYLEKNKEGATGAISYRFIGYQQRFEESERSEGTP